MGGSLKPEENRALRELTMGTHIPPLSLHRLSLLLPCLLIGCGEPTLSEAPPEVPIRNWTVGRWTNRYADDPNLAGVRVQQFPDCSGDAARHEGRHPAMILYVFKNGRVNQNGFEPDGTIREDFWWSIGPDHYLWDQIDRSVARPK